MEELFVPYIEGQRYLEREIKNLTDLFSSYLSAFTRYHVIIELLLRSSPLQRLLTFVNPGTRGEVN